MPDFWARRCADVMPEGRACLGRSPIRGYGHLIPTALKVGRVARVCVMGALQYPQGRFFVRI